MKEILKPILILFLLINTLSAQDSYNIIKLNISSESDDFSPFMWNDDLIFTSERHPKKLLIEYTDSKRQSGVSSLFKAGKLTDIITHATKKWPTTSNRLASSIT